MMAKLNRKIAEIEPDASRSVSRINRTEMITPSTQDLQFGITEGYPQGVKSLDGSILIRRTTRDLPYGNALYFCDIAGKVFSIRAAEANVSNKPIHETTFEFAEISALAEKVGANNSLDGRTLFRVLAPGIILIQKTVLGTKYRKLAAVLRGSDGEQLDRFEG